MSTRLYLQIIIVVLRKWLSGCCSQLLFVASLGLVIDLKLRRLESRSLNKVKLIVSTELARQPQKRFFKIVVGLGRDIVILEVLLSVEGNLLGLDLSVLDFNLISAENNRDVFADASQVTVPVRNVLVGNARGDVEHDDRTLPLNVVPVTQTTKLLLTSSIPDVEFDRSAVCMKGQRVDFYTKSSYIFLFKFSSQVTLHKSRLTNTSITNEDQFEFRNVLFGLSHFDITEMEIKKKKR
mmetsp:Transcript_12107/g.20095  ORF Transcript_12107/g.20095 Transcript_12107/m.20095 type:complete len:238 (-) Transcript_12107:71-784(-)